MSISPNLVSPSSLQGWIPIDFSSLSLGGLVAALPIDPINTAASLHYYAYVTDRKQWVLAVLPSSEKYDDTVSREDGSLTPSTAATRLLVKSRVQCLLA